MAFRKDVTLDTGAVVKHWRVIEAHINYEATTLDVRVKGWVTKAMFQAGAPAIADKSFGFAGASFPLHPGQSENTRSVIETAILADPFFSGAVAD